MNNMEGSSKRGRNGSAKAAYAVRIGRAGQKDWSTVIFKTNRGLWRKASRV